MVQPERLSSRGIDDVPHGLRLDMGHGVPLDRPDVRNRTFLGLDLELARIPINPVRSDFLKELHVQPSHGPVPQQVVNPNPAASVGV